MWLVELESHAEDLGRGMELLLHHQEHSVPSQGLAPDDVDVDDVEGKVPVNFPSSAALANNEDEGPALPLVPPSASPSATSLPTDPLPASADPTPINANQNTSAPQVLWPLFRLAFSSNHQRLMHHKR